MTNILFTITKSEIGGAQKFVKEQIDITTNIFNVYLCTNQQGWLSQQCASKVKGQLFAKQIESKSSLSFIYVLYKYIKKNNISLVITNSANAGFYGRLAAFFARVPSCYISHGWSSVYNGGKLSGVLNVIEQILSIISSKVICVSDNDYKIAINKIGIAPAKLLILKNAIFPIVNHVSHFTKNDTFTMIALARFAKPKRIDLMIDAFKNLPNFQLHLAGDGPELKFWQDYVAVNNITNITFLGEVPSFNCFLNYDGFMLISDSEGLPISAIEAMSAGLPLILSNVGGCPELIKNNGILVNNASDDIINAIIKLQQQQAEMSANSKLLYNECFNLNNNANKYIAIYLNIITPN